MDYGGRNLGVLAVALAMGGPDEERRAALQGGKAREWLGYGLHDPN